MNLNNKNQNISINEGYVKEETLDAYHAKKRKKSNRRRKLWISIVGVLACGYLLVSMYNNKTIHADLLEEHGAQEEELASAQQYQEDLVHYIGMLEDEEYVLNLARSEYFLTEGNEIVFNFVDEQDPTRSYIEESRQEHLGDEEEQDTEPETE
jgi:cell division protein DivIC